MEMCERCKRICDDEKIKILEKQLKKQETWLIMVEALQSQIGRLENALQLAYQKLGE